MFHWEIKKKMDNKTKIVETSLNNFSSQILGPIIKRKRKIDIIEAKEILARTVFVSSQNDNRKNDILEAKEIHSPE